MAKASRIYEFYNAFRDISHVIHSSINVDEVLDLIVWKASEALKAKGSLLRVLNLETQQFELSAFYGLSDAFFAKRPASHPRIVTDLYDIEKIVIIRDLLNDPRVQFPQDLQKEGIQMIMDLPLHLRADVAGLLRLYFESSRAFDEEEREFAISLAEQCACAIDKVWIIQEQQTKYDLLALHTEKLSALGRMSAGIAHEINNPLAGVLLYSSNLYKKVPDEGPLKEGLEIIMRETQRCKIIIQELLEFSRDKEPQKNLSDINGIIDRSISILENEFHLRHIAVEKDLDEKMTETLIDGNQLQQVFVNLFLNAAQAIEDDGIIAVRTRIEPESKRIIVIVDDDGCGISNDHIDKIFEPFFSTKKNGSGLGLAVSYGIIRNHHGTLKASKTPDNKTRFTISLPVIKKKGKSL